MDRKEETNEILRAGGFGEIEVLHLRKLRKERDEREKLQALAYHRRLEFVRWLVNTGKLTDQIA
ncbi:MAG TPA: hypothetical protein VFN23_09715 [Ktedonobacteraceae bacterium]|jgi:hypothetical protein|nr:hypothetical protein [Ktedonobacteraceae bacterium]